MKENYSLVKIVVEVVRLKLILNEKKIEVLIQRKPNKNIYMRFQDQNTLVVSCNRWISEKEIERVLEKNKQSLAKMQKKKAQEEEKDIFFQYLGKSYTRVFDGESKEVTFLGDNVFAKDEKMLEKFYKKECIRIFQSEVNRIVPYFPDIPKFSLKIRYMKTRWGVNHLTNHTITLNSELLKKDLDLLDYVIIHELCHFYEANHSLRFWRHVEEYYPKYKEARKRLRNG